MVKLIDGTTVLIQYSGTESVVITTPDGYNITVESSEWISDVIVNGPSMKCPIALPEGDMVSKEVIEL